MVSPRKMNPAAGFGDILAGLDAAADRPSAGPASPRGGEKSAQEGNVSWIQSAWMRALAAQTAHRVTSSAEPRRSDGGEGQRATRDSAAARRSATASRPSRQAEPYFHENDVRAATDHVGPAAAAPQPERSKGSAKQEAFASHGARSNPVHALQRLLGQIPMGMRAGASVVASALGGVNSARASAEAVKRARKSRPGEAGPRKSEDETIAEELGLREDLAIDELRRIRRDFAKKNHPDRFEPALRLGAARRMTIANMLIDARLKQRPPLP
jgi:hypothetical protein